jgi:hypothetical protein
MCTQIAGAAVTTGTRRKRQDGNTRKPCRGQVHFAAQDDQQEMDRAEQWKCLFSAARHLSELRFVCRWRFAILRESITVVPAQRNGDENLLFRG